MREVAPTLEAVPVGQQLDGRHDEPDLCWLPQLHGQPFPLGRAQQVLAAVGRGPVGSEGLRFGGPLQRRAEPAGVEHDDLDLLTGRTHDFRVIEPFPGPARVIGTDAVEFEEELLGPRLEGHVGAPVVQPEVVIVPPRDDLRLAPDPMRLLTSARNPVRFGEHRERGFERRERSRAVHVVAGVDEELRAVPEDGGPDRLGQPLVEARPDCDAREGRCLVRASARKRRQQADCDGHGQAERAEHVGGCNAEEGWSG